MRAAVFHAPQDIRLERRERPLAAAGEVLIEVAAAGLCAGDLYIFQGRNPYVTFPRIGGHEIAGTVVEAADRAMLGRRVVVEPFIGCGTCYACRVRKSNCCVRLRIIGVQRDGGFADYVAAPLDRLHDIPGTLSMRDASFAEPVAIAVQALRRARLEAGERVLVLGAGPIGLAVVEVARETGAAVWITDPNEDRLAAGGELGAYALSQDGLASTVADITDGDGFGLVVEATGVTSVMTQALGLVAAGGRVVVLGLARRGADVAFSALDLTRKEATILGSRASVDCFPEALRLLSTGVIRMTRLARDLPLAQAPEIFAELAANPAALHKVVFSRGPQ